MRERLRELTGALRDAHAAMDGEQIRALSARQRALVGELTTPGPARGAGEPAVGGAA